MSEEKDEGVHTAGRAGHIRSFVLRQGACRTRSSATTTR